MAVVKLLLKNWGKRSIFQLPDKARKLDHLSIGDITCQCIYIVICRHVFLTYTVLVCNCKQENCNMDVSLYYKTFPLLMKKLLFNWHTQDNRGWWCVVVKGPVMLYTAILNPITLFFIVTKIVSSTHFIFIRQLLRHSVQAWMVLERFNRCSANFANVRMFQKCFICLPCSSA